MRRLYLLIVRAPMPETTALGAAAAAGAAKGVEVWNLEAMKEAPGEEYLPSIPIDGRFYLFSNLLITFALS